MCRFVFVLLKYGYLKIDLNNDDVPGPSKSMAKEIARECRDERNAFVSVYVWLAGDVQALCPPNTTEIHIELCVGKDICFPGECRASEATDVWLELEKWFGDHAGCLSVCLLFVSIIYLYSELRKIVCINWMSNCTLNISNMVSETLIVFWSMT